ncbi:helix-turn-helix transcriptional regulator [Flavobacterium franklandianum]|uniref:Helix-turn-helix transcriptional regulator n=1 Tax=Flavobacterium franklandianum TaxID=2594430 RepID=A0A553C5Z0_9FLAO|nr:helix-turn-helix transcriptional regulator [Flavobacterium franklandianum]TRX27750.1 helix-turn-helix transcriptional regulator [Flavobacterium franklandianum]
MGKEIDVLSKSELRVLTLISAGFTSEAIGLKLEITKSTVQTHRRNMLRKTGFNNTQQLVGWAVREGLLK